MVLQLLYLWRSILRSCVTVGSKSRCMLRLVRYQVRHQATSCGPTSGLPLRGDIRHTHVSVRGYV